MNINKFSICHKLNLRGLAYEKQEPLAVQFKGIKLDCGYSLDIVVEDKIIIKKFNLSVLRVLR
jgi:GxxExxY protein